MPARDGAHVVVTDLKGVEETLQLTAGEWQVVALICLLAMRGKSFSCSIVGLLSDESAGLCSGALNSV